MIQTSARLLQLLSLLQARRFWTGSALSEALEITERTVRRDVDRLRELGYPVHATSGVGGGYALGAGTDLPPMPLEDDEAVAVAVGLRAAATGVVTGLEDASIRALAKLEVVLPKRLRRQVTALNAVSVGLPDRGPRVDGEVLSGLAAACRDLRLTEFGYAAPSGERTHRRVEPYHLVHSHSRWYLLAFDRIREDWRTFRLDRIGPEVPAATTRFSPRPLPDSDVAAWVGRAVHRDRHRYRARITVRAPAPAVAALFGPQWARVEAIDGDQCTLHTGGDDLRWLAFYIAMIPHEYAVHEPPELVDYLRGVGERIGRATSPCSLTSTPGEAP